MSTKGKFEDLPTPIEKLSLYLIYFGICLTLGVTALVLIHQ